MSIQWTPLGAFTSWGIVARELRSDCVVGVHRHIMAARTIVVLVLGGSAGDLQQYRGRFRWRERRSGARASAFSPSTDGTLPVVNRRAAFAVGRGEVVQSVRIGKRQLLIFFAVEM